MQRCSEIEEMLLIASAALHPQGAEVAELVAVHVPTRRIMALYPLEAAELVQLVRNRLAAPEQILHFVQNVQQAAAIKYEVLYDTLMRQDFQRLEQQEQELFSKHMNLNDLADAVRDVYGSESYVKVRDALLVTLATLWLAQHWQELAELKGLEAALLKQLDALCDGLNPPQPVSF